MTTDKNGNTVYQVIGDFLTRYGVDEYCYFWTTDKDEAEKWVKENTGYDDTPLQIVEGTDYIKNKCRCGSIHTSPRYDAYGIATGNWCNDCYENDYPYRKDRYDYKAYGERLDDEY